MSDPWQLPGSGTAGAPSADRAPTGAPPFSSAPVSPGSSVPGSSVPPGAPGGPGAPVPPGVPGARQRRVHRSSPIVPLRPLGLGDILSGAVAAMRTAPRALFSVTAVVMGIATLVTAILTTSGSVRYFSALSALGTAPEAEPGLADMGLPALIVTSLLGGVVTLFAGNVLTGALVAMVDAAVRGRPVTAALGWQMFRARLGRILLLSVVVSLLPGLVAAGLVLAVTVPLALSAPPTVAVAVGIATGLAALAGFVWISIRLVLAIPACVVEDASVGASLRRSLQLSSGRSFWFLLLVVAVTWILVFVAYQVLSLIPVLLGTAAYALILFASNFTMPVLAGIVLMVATMIGTFLCYVATYPFYAGALALAYLDQRMKREAYDVHLVRERMAADEAAGTRR